MELGSEERSTKREREGGALAALETTEERRGVIMRRGEEETRVGSRMGKSSYRDRIRVGFLIGFSPVYRTMAHLSVYNER